MDWFFLARAGGPVGCYHHAELCATEELTHILYVIRTLLSISSQRRRPDEDSFSCVGTGEQPRTVPYLCLQYVLP